MIGHLYHINYVFYQTEGLTFGSFTKDYYLLFFVAIRYYFITIYHYYWNFWLINSLKMTSRLFMNLYLSIYVLNDINLHLHQTFLETYKNSSSMLCYQFRAIPSNLFIQFCLNFLIWTNLFLSQSLYKDALPLWTSLFYYIRVVLWI